MDFSVWGEVYGYITSHLGRWAYLLVFLLGGGLLSGFWWVVGLSYERQQAQALRANATDTELTRLATEVQHLQRLDARQPIVVNVPPQQVAQPSAPLPLITTQGTRVTHDASRRVVDIMVALRNTMPVPTHADLTFEILLGGTAVVSKRSSQEIVGGGDNPRVEIENGVVFDGPDPHEQWVAGTLPMLARVIATYKAGDKTIEYVVEGIATAESPTLNITKNQRTAR